MRRYFCNCCGKEITTPERRYGIVFYNREEKTQKLSLMLCDTDIKKVRQFTFKPTKNVRLRKKPVWFNIVETHLGKCKSLYQVPEWFLPQILSVDHSDPKNLWTENGTRYYTKEYVLSKVDGSIDPGNADECLMVYTKLLFEKQTEDEKASYETKHYNNRGFNKSDAKFMSAMARESFNKGTAALTAKQLEVVRKRFRKYAEQVANILNENNGVE